jgi:hypothetical protein
LNYTRIFRKSLPVYSEGLKPILPLKRRNPATGVPFRHGDVRADGYRFWGYKSIVAKRTGLLGERWLSPKSFKKTSAHQAEHRKANVAKIAARDAKYAKDNPEKIAAKSAKYAKANPGKINAKTARRHAAKLQRTPPWLTKEQRAEIEAIYVLCAERTRVTGVPHAVDHILPLRGRTVSGLHIAANLQIITASENCSKNNRYVQE